MPPSMAWHGVFRSAAWQSGELGAWDGWEVGGEVLKDCIVEREEEELRAELIALLHTRGTL